MLRRQPAQEDPELRRRRLTAADSVRTVIDRIRNSLRQGYLWQDETPEGDSIRNATMGWLEGRGARETRLRTLASHLRELLVTLDSGPVPETWFERRVDVGALISDVEGPQPWQDVCALYLHRQVAVGRDLSASSDNVFYLMEVPIPQRRVRPAAIASAIQTGTYLIVPDPDAAPLVYRRLTGYEGWQDRGVIVDVWHDDVGYFYFHRRGKIYLPERP